MSALRVHQIVGDYMSPTLRGGWDSLLIAPVDRYDYTGIYIMDDGGIHRAERSVAFANPEIFLWGDNAGYTRQTVPLDWFNAHVAAKAVAIIKMQVDPDELHHLAGKDWEAAPLALAAA